MLLAAGADLDIHGQSGSSMLNVAISHHHVDVVQVLLAAGADPDREYKPGLNALHLAIFNRRPFMVEAMLDGGADPNYQPQVVQGRPSVSKSPLQYAIDLGDQTLVGILLRHRK